MTTDPETATFLVAGPVRIHPRVLRAMATPSLNHRGGAFREVVAEIRELLPVLYGTRGGHDAILTGSGSAGLEAMYSALLPRDRRTLVLKNGHFGERSDQIVRRYAKEVTTLEAPWGRPIPVAAAAAELAKGDVGAVCVVHNETSVGLANPLAELAPHVRRAGARFLVDGISAVAGIPVDVDGWGIDALVAGSQKGLAAPAGLALVHLSDRAVEALAPTTFYLDLKKHVESLRSNDTPWTPAVPLFLALREALRVLRDEGLATRLARCAALAGATRAAVGALGLELFPEAAHASDTVTAIRIPDGMSDGDVRKVLEERYRVLLQGGQGPAKGKIFRIGHMGIADWPDLLVTFAGLERILAGAGRRAVDGASLRAIVERMPAPA